VTRSYLSQEQQQRLLTPVSATECHNIEQERFDDIDSIFKKEVCLLLVSMRAID
jgi:hypothetical protein